MNRWNSSSLSACLKIDALTSSSAGFFRAPLFFMRYCVRREPEEVPNLPPAPRVTFACPGSGLKSFGSLDGASELYLFLVFQSTLNNGSAFGL